MWCAHGARVWSSHSSSKQTNVLTASRNPHLSDRDAPGGRRVVGSAGGRRSRRRRGAQSGIELPGVGKLQILLFVGFIEFLSYKMKGGDMYKPGDLLGAAYFVPEDEPGWVRAATRLPVQRSRRRPPRPPVVVLLRASRRTRANGARRPLTTVKLRARRTVVRHCLETLRPLPPRSLAFRSTTSRRSSRTVASRWSDSRGPSRRSLSTATRPTSSSR